MEPSDSHDEAREEGVESGSGSNLPDSRQWAERLRALTDAIYEAEEGILADPPAATWQKLFQYASLLSELANTTGQVEHLTTSIEMAGLAEKRMFATSPEESAIVISHIGMCLGQQHNLDSSQFPDSLDLGIEKLSLAVERLHPARDLDILEGLRILLRKRTATVPTDEDTRLVLTLAEEIMMGTSPDEEKWTTRFQAWCAALVMWLLREQQNSWWCINSGPLETQPKRRDIFLEILAKLCAFGIVNQQNAIDIYGKDLSSQSNSTEESLSSLMDRATALIEINSEDSGNSKYLKLLSGATRSPARDTIEPTIQLFKQHASNRADPGCLDSMVLGLLLKDKFELSGDKEALKSGIELLKAVVDSSSSSPLQRIDAARSCAALLLQNQELSTASELLSEAVRVLPQISTRSMRRQNQERNLSIVSGLAEEACATALAAGRNSTEAVQTLEQATALIMSFEIDRRTEAPPSNTLLDTGVLDKFEAVQEQLNRALSSGNGATVEETKIARETAWAKYNEAVDAIRTQGHPGFLRPLGRQEMLQLASEGPLVILNCHELRCDAIIVTREASSHIPLTKLDHKELEQRMQTLTRDIIKGSFRTYRSRCLQMMSLLSWLWDCVVGPVWDALREDLRDEASPRIWWIRTGALTLAPIHAAGSSADLAKTSGFDRVISSYTPSIKALAYARTKAKNAPKKRQRRFTAISMPTTPGKNPLDNLGDEIESIEKDLKARGWDCSTLQRPCAEEVLHSLVDAPTVLHCGCHGISDYHQPSESALLFVKSTHVSGLESSSLPSVSETLDPLTIAQLSNVWLKRAVFIMYLSACSTAGTLNPRLSSQAMHIAGEFLLLGLPHVIGTLWESQDEACRIVATRFYTNLALLECAELDNRAVATALHEAVNYLKKQAPEDVLAWVPFIHYGV